MVIRQTFEAAIMTNLHPRSQIDIYVQVLQADGGMHGELGLLLQLAKKVAMQMVLSRELMSWFCTRTGHLCAGINAANLALIDAGIPLHDYVTACTAGCVDGTPILGIRPFSIAESDLLIGHARNLHVHTEAGA